MPRGALFPLGAEVTLERLSEDPHPLLARLREREPVSWVPAIDGWLVTRHDLAVAAMRAPHSFTVHDPRFSTAQVIGPSMLSLDGTEHDRHRAPFAAQFRPAAVRERFAGAVHEEATRLIDELEPAGGCELRRAFAGPLAAATITRALGLERGDVAAVLGWYDAIVAAVTSVTEGRGVTPEARRAFAQLRDRLAPVIDDREFVADAAVLLFGGIETTEGMIANSVLLLLARPESLERVRRDPDLIDGAVEESLRLEPAAAVVDRYATADVDLGGALIAHGELVRISIAAANRDPGVFERPDQFDLFRPPGRRHLAFAQGPHVCLGVHLARLEARTALAMLLERLPSVRLDPDRPARIEGLVFRKPPELYVQWS